MAVDSTTATRWNDLHRDKRHRLDYPSEHVVRFLKRIDHLDGYKWALDIGCGSGRHLALLEEFGYTAYGCDSSPVAVGRAKERLAGIRNSDDRIAQAEMTDLGTRLNAWDFFDVVLSYGVFYYGTRDDMRQAVTEMHRVMRPGGHGFLCLRSALDWRAEHLRDGVLDLPGEPEDGMQMTFLDGRALAELVLAPFKEVEVNVTHTTTDDGKRANCDWLVAVQK